MGEFTLKAYAKEHGSERLHAATSRCTGRGAWKIMR